VAPNMAECSTGQRVVFMALASICGVIGDGKLEVRALWNILLGGCRFPK